MDTQIRLTVICALPVLLAPATCSMTAVIKTSIKIEEFKLFFCTNYRDTGCLLQLHANVMLHKSSPNANNRQNIS